MLEEEDHTAENLEFVIFVMDLKDQNFTFSTVTLVPNKNEGKILSAFYLCVQAKE